MIRFFILFALLFSFSGSALGQTPRWFEKIKEIRLLVDSYDQVIKLLGTPEDGTREKKLAHYFYLEGGRVFVSFASGDCVVTDYSGGQPIGWKVPPWTVDSVSFYPKRPFSPKKFKIDPTGFQKHKIEDSRNAYSYENDDIGMDYTLNSDGKIESVSLYPGAKLRHLHCKPE